jgi:hypothetical protein
MQINATVIAAQQAAREARAALLAPQPAASFLTDLSSQNAPAPAAPKATTPAPMPQAPSRPGSLLDIKI